MARAMSPNRAGAGARPWHSSRRHFVTALGGAVVLPALGGRRRALADHLRPAEDILAVTRFGAVGDGRTMATAAVQRALDACGAHGGRTVLIPPGRYLCGALFLRSHVHVLLAPGATLLASH